MKDYKDINKGDKFTFRSRKGIFLTKPEYRITPSSGLYYADVKFDDGEIKKGWMICLTELSYQDALVSGDEQ